MLAAFPESCQARPSLGPNIRVGVVTPYLVIYRYLESKEQVSVIRIVHGRRNITQEVLRGG